MSATVASEIRAGIGARLKAGRERAGMTLLQVAEKLHVDPKSIEAVEAERFGDLGAAVYVKGHIKRYSELVNENTAELLDQYTAATKPVMPDLTQLPKASRHADPRKLVLPSLVALIAFALVGSVWWILQNIGKTSFGNPARPQEVTTDESVTPESRATPTELLIPPSTDTPAPAAASAGTSAPAARQGASAPQAANAAPASSTGSRAGSAQPTTAGRGSGTRAGTSAGAASSAQITKSSRVANAAVASDAGRLKSVDVTLKFAADSWAEVYDADGQRLFYDIGSANSSHAVTGTPPLHVVLGNAPGVSVNINGRPAKVPPSVVQNDNAQFTINRSGRIVRARPNGAATAESKPNGE